VNSSAGPPGDCVRDEQGVIACTAVSDARLEGSGPDDLIIRAKLRPESSAGSAKTLQVYLPCEL
jgi:hypothetical protein